MSPERNVWQRYVCTYCDRRAFTFFRGELVCLRHLFARRNRWEVRSATMRETRHA